MTGDRDIDMQAFDQLRAEIRGRKAIGTMVMLGAGAMVMNGPLRGEVTTTSNVSVCVKTWVGRNVHEANDGNWYSYDGMGPVSDWIAAGC